MIGIDGSCNASTSYDIQYTTSPTIYQQQIYNYTALSTDIAILEFGFKAKNPSKTWHLDDVSIVDTTALNSEILVNGGFENGSLIGWQVACSSLNCGGTGGILVQTSCHTGSYCYEGACQGAYDFLRQSFSVTAGRVYMLSFWLYTDGHSAEAAYVDIREGASSG